MFVRPCTCFGVPRSLTPTQMAHLTALVLFAYSNHLMYLLITIGTLSLFVPHAPTTPILPGLNSQIVSMLMNFFHILMCPHLTPPPTALLTWPRLFVHSNNLINLLITIETPCPLLTPSPQLHQFYQGCIF